MSDSESEGRFIITLGDGSQVALENQNTEVCLLPEASKKIKLCRNWNGIDVQAIDEDVARDYLETAAPGLASQLTNVKTRVLVRELYCSFFKECYRLFAIFDNHDDGPFLARGPFEQAVAFLDREPPHSVVPVVRQYNENSDTEEDDMSFSSVSSDGSTTSSMDLSFHHCPTCGSATRLFCRSTAETRGEINPRYVNISDQGVVQASDYGGDLKRAPWTALLCEECHEDEVEDRDQHYFDSHYPDDGRLDGENPDAFHVLWSDNDQAGTITNVGGVKQQYLMYTWAQVIANEQQCYSWWFSEKEFEDDERVERAVINFSGAIKRALDDYIVKSLRKLILKDVVGFLKDGPKEDLDKDKAEMER